MKAIMLVLDGLGVGAMADVTAIRPQDSDANTLAHVAAAVGGLNLPNLSSLGLGLIQPAKGLDDEIRPLASYGRANLGYAGADSYLGHQTLMGTIPALSEFTLMPSVSAEIEATLRQNGYAVRRYPADGHTLIVNEAVVIADNLEADAGQNINVTVGMAHISFDDALRIGQLVRSIVRVTRVIVFGGPGLSLSTILDNVETHGTQTGVNSPALGVYDENLVVRHMGYGVDPQLQIASILSNAGKRVSLIGKMADLIVCPHAYRNPVVATTDVVDEIIRGLREDSFDFLAATVQETDLAGHQGDSQRFASILHIVDNKLSALLPLLKEEDLLIITADHGNDPTLKSGMHTREQVPVLLYRAGKSPKQFEDRVSLADMAATVSADFNTPMPQDGTAIQIF
jgi:phosphopentomutase